MSIREKNPKSSFKSKLIKETSIPKIKSKISFISENMMINSVMSETSFVDIRKIIEDIRAKASLEFCFMILKF